MDRVMSFFERAGGGWSRIATMQKDVTGQI